MYTAEFYRVEMTPALALEYAKLILGYTGDSHKGQRGCPKYIRTSGKTIGVISENIQPAKLAILTACPWLNAGVI
jgi:hypothetical protein